MTLNAISDLPAASPTTPAATRPAPLPAPAFLTARQLVAELGVSRRTLTTWNQRGVIPSVRVGRVRRYELEAVKTALRAHGAAARPAPCGASLPSSSAVFTADV
ncbi:MAG: hypothetical protein B7Z37_31080 [Verrucomicrobia bacterium 12-59-8]|nr:MAG: hypothetical protein B7Z37_31080 [Verrucomicrobia bacterium 12-59-8]